MLKTVIFVRNDQTILHAIRVLNRNTDLIYLIIENQNLIDEIKLECESNNITWITHDSFRTKIQDKMIEDLDFIFSFYYQKIIEKEILDFPINGCVNFHPAPLPRYRGVGNYSLCILEELDFWGVSAHFMDEKIDNGAIISTLEFKIEKSIENYRSLEIKTRIYMLKLFEEVLDFFITGNPIENKENSFSGEISYLSKAKIKKEKLISLENELIDLDKKVRAYWSPPNHGASIIINGTQYTLLNEQLLKQISNLYKT